MSEPSYDELKRRTEQLAAQLEQMQNQHARLSSRAEFGSTFSEILHELNQPLSSISNFSFAASQLLSRDQLTISEHSDLLNWVGNISDQSQCVIEMIQRLRVLGRSSSPDQPIYLDRVITKSFQKTATRVEVSCPAGLPAVRGDWGQLEQVLLSLVKILCPSENSITAEIRQLQILVKQIDTKIELTISAIGLASNDTGPKSNRFELAICRWIILSHGGSLCHELQDSTECYRIDLPVCESLAD